MALWQCVMPKNRWNRHCCFVNLTASCHASFWKHLPREGRRRKHRSNLLPLKPERKSTSERENGSVHWPLHLEKQESNINHMTLHCSTHAVFLTETLLEALLGGEERKKGEGAGRKEQGGRRRTGGGRGQGTSSLIIPLCPLCIYLMYINMCLITFFS